MNVAFKRVQPLPMLRSATNAGQIAPPGLRLNPAQEPVLPETRVSAAPAAARQLPRPRVAESGAEEVTFVVLALGAVFCVGQAFTTMITLSPDAPQFAVWITRLLA